MLGEPDLFLSGNILNDLNCVIIKHPVDHLFQRDEYEFWIIAFRSQCDCVELIFHDDVFKPDYFSLPDPRNNYFSFELINFICRQLFYFLNCMD